MSKAAKFIVIINETITSMENNSILFYSNLFGKSNSLGEKYANENLSGQNFSKIQNDFLVEILAIGEEKKPLSFLKIDSRRLINQNLEANKAIRVSDIVYFSLEDLILLLKRAEEVAVQRRHDLIWIEAFEVDSILINTAQSLGYERFDFEESSYDKDYPKRIYFKKQIHQSI
ncbi:hypothetical protein KHA90_20365 [Flavobacterium psychroterrae]|uniref:Uncharacterized protein n=1 Tax=Flavobacterium psychroterrae TaxID=2133767 RepID=A0ABS5PI51_9FLAO|nr:hypothetical protein [Flavobacterium psychroterrae]MBS7233376.1 hypothetical protein [Flavobacterium psychroterrae]